MIPIELRQRGYQALVAALGSFDAIRFLQQAGWGVGDYTIERRTHLKQVTRTEFWRDVHHLRERKKTD